MSQIFQYQHVMFKHGRSLQIKNENHLNIDAYAEPAGSTHAGPGTAFHLLDLHLHYKSVVDALP